MAKRKTVSLDFNANAAVMVLEATGSKRAKGEDLIGDPKLRKAYLAAKKKAKAKKP